MTTPQDGRNRSEHQHEKQVERAFYRALALVLTVLGGVFALGYFWATR